MIEIEKLTKRFDGFTALSGLELKIAPASIYGLVGPNGSGKSTLMRLIAGVYRPDEGRVLIDGECSCTSVAARQKVLYVPDDLYFPPKATAEDMAAFYRSVYSGFSPQDWSRLRGMFPIDTGRRLNTFSKGMRRQAALMAALCCRPQYLLLDEAFDGLDPVIRLMVKKLIAGQIDERGMTVVVTSHNLRELEDLCDHIGLLHNGGVLFEKEINSLKLGFCKVQAAYRQPVDWSRSGLEILQSQQRGSLVSMLVRGDTETVLGVLRRYSPMFCEAIPLTLEEIFIGEMEAAGYDYSSILF